MSRRDECGAVTERIDGGRCAGEFAFDLVEYVGLLSGIAVRETVQRIQIDADARLQLQAEIRRLAATVDERARGQANLGSRLQTQVQAQSEEILRLRRQLEDAQQKLDAIKTMEKSFIERGATPPPSREPARDTSRP